MNPLAGGDMFVATIAGCVKLAPSSPQCLIQPIGVIRISAVAVASEIAALRPDVQGPGTFLPALMDELSKLTPEVLSEKVNIEIVS